MKYLKILLISLLIIIFGFLIVLLIPFKKENENEKYHINVENDIINEEFNLEENINVIKKDDYSNKELEEVNESLSKSFGMNDNYNNENILSKEEFESYKEEFLKNIYEENGEDFYYMDTTIIEEYDSEYCDNYVKNHILMDNLIVEPKKDYYYEYDERGNLHAYRIYDVFDESKFENVDGIAMDIESGEIFGYSLNGLMYDFNHYEYNPEWIEFCETVDWENFGENGTLVPFNPSSVGDIIDEYVDYVKYPTKYVENKFKWEDGNEYYKVTFHNTDNYVLIDYWNGFKYEVIDGVKYDNIKWFKE